MFRFLSAIALALLVAGGFWYQSHQHNLEVANLQREIAQQEQVVSGRDATIKALDTRIAELQKEIDALTQSGHKEALELLKSLPEICSKIAFANLMKDEVCASALRAGRDFPDEPVRLMVLREPASGTLQKIRDAFAARCALIGDVDKPNACSEK